MLPFVYCNQICVTQSDHAKRKFIFVQNGGRTDRTLLGRRVVMFMVAVTTVRNPKNLSSRRVFNPTFVSRIVDLEIFSGVNIITLH